MNEKMKLLVTETKKKELFRLIKNDLDFLKNKQIIDYSLLIGIHDIEETSKKLSDSNMPQSNGLEEPQISSRSNDNLIYSDLNESNANSVNDKDMFENYKMQLVLFKNLSNRNKCLKSQIAS